MLLFPLLNAEHRLEKYTTLKGTRDFAKFFQDSSVVKTYKYTLETIVSTF